MVVGIYMAVMHNWNLVYRIAGNFSKVLIWRIDGFASNTKLAVSTLSAYTHNRNLNLSRDKLMLAKFSLYIYIYGS